MSANKRKRNVLTVETKLEIINKLEMTTMYNSPYLETMLFIAKLYFVRLSEKISYPEHPWSQLVRIIGVLLYYFLQLIRGKFFPQ